MIVLLPHCGFLSETSRMLHIAQALQARGESVALATHGGPYSAMLDSAGMPYTLLEPEMNDVRCARFLSDLVQIGRPGVRLLQAEEVRRGVAAELAFFRQTGARMAVTGFTLTSHLSTRLAGIPLAASHGGSFVPPVCERGLMPVPTAMPMPGAEWLPDWLKRVIVNRSSERMVGPTRFLNEVADELGVEPVPSLAALMLADLTLVTDTPEVLGVSDDDLRAWRPRRPQAHRSGTRLVYVGPMFARLDLPVPDPVMPFLDGSRPTALVVLSSATPAMLRAATSCARRAGLRVIVGATIVNYGANDDPDVIVAGILPNHAVMPLVDVAVTMGGQGSVQTAMASGTPLASIPLHLEQELNVALAARQGMAIPIARRDVGGDRMTQSLRRLAFEPDFRRAARRVACHYAGWNGPRQAAEEIVRYLQQEDVHSESHPTARRKSTEIRSAMPSTST